ncbi:hypothetical protein DDZ13_05665 [Coraliomargarita sinensis]|uniref:Tim44-like domain-containing protein n=1 Tax=Coraliomargarita sinensis TaxID=2174842 RepID=A0A317ZLF6_9BACT|nr:hypothetical protein [Coraliomargarita sinensis]PXA04659.1 hypothetical protein DDZ13_05665 [Coraliomargarita sinensis]
MLALTAGYYGLDYVKVHTSGDVVAYKRFAKAVMENDHHGVRKVSNKELAAETFRNNEERRKVYQGARVLFTYFEVISQKLARDGKSSSLVVEQVSRVSSGGQTGIWGDREIRVRHTAQLEKENHTWKVAGFIDPAMR